ncbi:MULTISPECIES: sugar phosphate isomerase/epimerase family protein [Ramlibacter]|uniref:TIM barrel protein n=1 Tax=Ramlibacter pinisoli TaxID=2682844 RepID=A0A6N8J153_9BURK|nr:MULTISPECIES: sugar phosphate isomerase/epimerase family protein [Ramlibacter]MBA2962825.1 sugar phosphate isomerase/epimerase [Ramlibacter sp. CGMCC 1.13660]MVQ32768.1 TIM barrel protein [Ramlibacter pinisoli]
MRDFSRDHRWLSINTATVRKSAGQELPLPAILEACARRGIRAVSPWRDQVAAIGLSSVSRMVKDLELSLSGYCRGGMFTATDAEGLKLAREDNRRAVEEAAELRAACLVLVVGALPGALAGKAAHKDIGLARGQVVDGIGELLEYARTASMPLAIEPLHPMYAADRACVNTMEQALDICDELDPYRSGSIGVAVDVYHTWWDPKLQQQIERAGGRRLLAFHVCDWLTPTQDLLNDRGMMGDGVIDIPRIRAWVEAQGFAGYSEVEIFSRDNWWKRPHEEVLSTCIERHMSSV